MADFCVGAVEDVFGSLADRGDGAERLTFDAVSW